MYNIIAKSEHLKTKDGSEQTILLTEDSNLKAVNSVDGTGNLKPYETLSINEDTDKKTNEDRDKKTDERGEPENWIIDSIDARDLAIALSDAITVAESNRKNTNDYPRKHPKQAKLK